MGDGDTPNLIGANRKPDGTFGPGNVANPAGRPVGSVSIVEGIKKKLLEIEPKNKKVYLDMFLDKLFHKAIRDGNEQLMKDMINRVDGMPAQKISGEDGGPIKIDIGMMLEKVYGSKQKSS